MRKPLGIMFVVLIVWTLINIAVSLRLWEHRTYVSPEERRQPVILAPVERDMILTQMRDFSRALHEVLDAARRGDTASARAVAAGAGNLAALKLETSGSLPMPYRRLAAATHTAFDSLAARARLGADSIFAATPHVTGTCVACHTTYRFGMR
jgi:hypothetical protein